MKWVAVLVVGVIVGVLGFAALRPDRTAGADFGPESAWTIDKESAAELFDCAGAGDQAETRCALDVMEKADAPDEAQAFFRQTHWFLDGFRESGIVDIGSVVVPWRANAIDDYLLLNGSPSVVSVEREAPPVAVFGQDPVYEPLRRAVNRSDDVPDADDLVLWETDEVFEDSQHAGRKIRFIFQWSLKDACHACDTGYLARVALEFAPDGTYLNAVPLDICWGGGGEAERVEEEAPRCPTPVRLPSG